MIYTGANRNLKIEPYEPCPIHPENKFKFCCFRRAKEEPWKKYADPSFSDSRINYLATNFWEETNYKVCFGFDNQNCSGTIKNAHTIQNNRILNLISVDNHVYRFKPNTKKDGVSSVLELISKNKASAFFGFCDHHDTELFKPIELQDYQGIDIQNFLFAFRSLTLELHKKTRQLENIKKMFQMQPRAMIDPQFVYLYRVAQMDVRDYMNEYESLKENYLQGKFDCFETIFKQINFEIPFAACATFTIEYDLNGKILNDIYNTSQDEKVASIHISVYPIEGRSNIIISYHKNDEDIYSDYFSQLRELEEEMLLKFLNYLLINSTENIFFNPKYIDNLSSIHRRSLEDSFMVSSQPLRSLDLLAKGEYFNFNLFEH